MIGNRSVHCAKRANSRYGKKYSSFIGSAACRSDRAFARRGLLWHQFSRKSTKRREACGRSGLLSSDQSLSAISPLAIFCIDGSDIGFRMALGGRKAMRRRDLIKVLSGAAVGWHVSARAQQPAKMLRVGTANAQPRSAPQWVAFVRRMAELGYVEGENFTYDHLQIANAAAWDAGYREVVARKPDILLAAGPENSLKAALAGADSLPIVMIAVDYDPLGKGYVSSLSRPSGSITGVYFQAVELVGKRLELLKQAAPEITTMTAFWDGSSADHWAALQTAAPHFAIRLTGIEFHERPYDYDRAIANAVPASRSFLYAGGSPFFFLDRAQLAQLAIRHRMASMFDLREQATGGGLMSYGPSLTGMFALAANYVDRIAKGAKPSDLPIMQPTKFELVINLKTASALELTVPPTLLARADDVVE